jgi:hypothetical protein
VLSLTFQSGPWYYDKEVWKRRLIFFGKPHEREERRKRKKKREKIEIDPERA